jgi:TetR/AcrR family transcriptional regulator
MGFGRRTVCQSAPAGALRIDTVRPVGLLQGEPLSDSTPQESPRMASRESRDVPSREKILEIAESLFARRGYQGAGLREVARLAGLSKSALFHHFPSKLELYEAVLTRILTRIDERLSEPATSSEGQGPMQRLLHRIEVLIDTLAASPTRAPLLLRSLCETELAEAPNLEGAERLKKIIDEFESLMTEGIAAGEIRSIPVLCLVIIRYEVDFADFSCAFRLRLLSPDALQALRSSLRRRRRPQGSCRSRCREHCTAPATFMLRSRKLSAQASAHRSCLLGAALPLLESLEGGAGYCEAGHCSGLASQGLQALLGMEEIVPELPSYGLENVIIVAVDSRHNVVVGDEHPDTWGHFWGHMPTRCKDFACNVM